MNDDEFMKLMAQVDPQTKRIPPGIREIVDAVEAAERERCIAACTSQRCEDPCKGEDEAYERAIDNCVRAIASAARRQKQTKG